MSTQQPMLLHDQPLATRVRELCQGARHSLELFSPYVRRDALEFVLTGASAESITIITTWSTQDVLAGSSDLGVYPLVTALGGCVQLLPGLHMKAVLADHSRAILGSANLTLKGLGLTHNANIECAVDAAIGIDELAWFADLISNSKAVTDQLYAAFNQHVAIEAKKAVGEPILEFDFGLWFGESGRTSELGLVPRHRDPLSFLNGWRDVGGAGARTNSAAAKDTWHDIELLGLPAERPESTARVMRSLTWAYFSLPLVRAFLEFAGGRQTYFGDARRWVRRHVPDGAATSLEVTTDITQRLLQWTSSLEPSCCTLDRPHYSQRLQIARNVSLSYPPVSRVDRRIRPVRYAPAASLSQVSP